MKLIVEQPKVKAEDLTIVDLSVDYVKDNIAISYFIDNGEMKVAEIATDCLVEYLKCFHPDYLAEFYYKDRIEGSNKFNAGDMMEDFKRKKALQKRFLIYHLNK